ncbi:coiled-coil domain-containing protein 194 [Erethizon dorsatum]
MKLGTSLHPHLDVLPLPHRKQPQHLAVPAGPCRPQALPPTPALSLVIAPRSLPARYLSSSKFLWNLRFPVCDNGARSLGMSSDPTVPGPHRGERGGGGRRGREAAGVARVVRSPPGAELTAGTEPVAPAAPPPAPRSGSQPRRLRAQARGAEAERLPGRRTPLPREASPGRGGASRAWCRGAPGATGRRAASERAWPGPGRAWRALALCGAALFLAAAAAGGALVAWNLAASTARGLRCPEPGANATTPPQAPVPELEELRRRLAEAVQREEALAGRLRQAERVREELEQALKAFEGRQIRLQTELKALETETDEARVQGARLGVENGALTEALARWEAAATEAARQREEAQQRAGAAEAEGEACAAREVALREHVSALEAALGAPRRGPRPRSGSRSRPRPRARPGPSRGCRRPPRRVRG